MPEIFSKAEAALSEGVILLLVSGFVRANTDLLGIDDRQAARELRRRLVVLANRRLLLALDVSPALEITASPAVEPSQLWSESLQWLSSRNTAHQDVPASASVRHDQLIALLRQSLILLRRIALTPGDNVGETSSAIIRSVIRPICESLATAIAIGSFDAQSYLDLGTEIMAAKAADVQDPEAELMKFAIALEAGPLSHDPRIREAVAGLARLAHWHIPAGEMSAALTEPSPSLMVCTDGPYLFQGAAEVVDYLGVPLATHGSLALCRCGQSASKPYCDGSHAALGFSGDKDARRVADSRDVYLGQQATVFDNRGICAHSGFCTDRLNGVFHAGQEPFVTPSGGRLDDIMRAVKRCPSGALSFGIHRDEMRQYADESRPPRIEISKDGPYRITGAIPLTDERGVPVVRNVGSSDEHYSLCRCGSSLNKPFCSGMHWSVSFTDPKPAPDWEPTLFEWAGGYPALLDMTTIFYSRHVPSDPIVGPLFARMEADHPERVAAWLSEVFGGPKFYSERYGGYTRMISQHLDKHLTQEQRSHWATLMAQSADEAGLPNDAEFRAAFMAYIEWGSRIAVENSTAGAKPPPNMPMPRWWWVCNALPGGRVSAVAPQIEEPVSAETPVLEPDEQPSFAKHIKGLFRPMDRNSMKFAFDLWAYEDVKKNADAILSRVRAGTMPCDKAWAPEKVELFRRWVQGDTRE